MAPLRILGDVMLSVNPIDDARQLARLRIARWLRRLRAAKRVQRWLRRVGGAWFRTFRAHRWSLPIAQAWPLPHPLPLKSDPLFPRWVRVRAAAVGACVRVACGILRASAALGERRLPLLRTAAEALVAVMGGDVKRDARILVVDLEQGEDYDVRCHKALGTARSVCAALGHFPADDALVRSCALAVRNLCAGSNCGGANVRRRACLPALPALARALSARLPPAPPSPAQHHVIAALCVSLGNICIDQQEAAMTAFPSLQPLLEAALDAAGALPGGTDSGTDVRLAACGALGYLAGAVTGAIARTPLFPSTVLLLPTTLPVLVRSLRFCFAGAEPPSRTDFLEVLETHATTLAHFLKPLAREEGARHRESAAAVADLPALLTERLPVLVARSLVAQGGNFIRPAEEACDAVVHALKALVSWGAGESGLLAPALAALPALLDGLVALSAHDCRGHGAVGLLPPLRKTCRLLKSVHSFAAARVSPGWAAPLEGRLRALFACASEVENRGFGGTTAAAVGDTLRLLGFQAPALHLCVLPPPALEARLRSCFECWAAAARPRECAHAPLPPPVCPICYGEWEEGESGEWVALKCGHLMHARCALSWGAKETRGYRKPPHHGGFQWGSFESRACSVSCPVDRSVVSVFGVEGEGGLRVATPPPEWEGGADPGDPEGGADINDPAPAPAEGGDSGSDTDNY